MSQRALGLLAAILALILVGVHVAFKAQPSSQDIAGMSEQFKNRDDWVGKIAPDFDVPTLDGQRFRLADHVGREVVVLNFFATWCAPCRGEMPELNHLAQKNSSAPFYILAIDVEEKRDLVSKFVSDVPVVFPVALDDSGGVAKRYGANAFPTTILIGPDGRIQLYQSGAMSNTDVAFAGVLEPGLQKLRSSPGISKDDYLQAAAHETYAGGAGSTRARDAALHGRASTIAVAMDCPCGCDKKVETCGCRTAKKIKARLGTMTLEGRSDVDVARELDREFCMKEPE